MTASSVVEGLASRLESEMRDIVGSRKMPLYDMMSYHMGWDGEHAAPDGIRPRGALALLACRAVEGDVDVALPAAAAVELVNGFCEIHDDVQGGMPQRDNRDAVWWKWGPAQAINAGDGMHALARLALFRLIERGVSPDVTFRAVQILDDASLRTCEGRFLDLEAQERIDLSVESYLEMASSKSGSLVSCAMKMGALAALADEPVVEAVGRAGDRLGVAMQMRSDVRELWGSGERVPASSPEVMNKKKLLPVVYAVETASAKGKRRIGDIYFKRVLGSDDVAVLREAIEETGTRGGCEELIEKRRAEVAAALDAAKLPAEGLADINDFIDTLLAP